MFCHNFNFSKAEEFQLNEDGRLQISRQVFNVSEYCLEETWENRTVARVCDFLEEEDRKILLIISQYLIPTLLIISDIFLLLTFFLHVVVPDSRKQIFGWMKMSTILALFLGYQWFIIILLGGPSLPHYNVLCVVLGLFMQVRTLLDYIRHFLKH